MSKELHEEIEELAMDVWGADGTLGDLVAGLSNEQIKFLLDMKIAEVMSNPVDFSFAFEVIANA